MSPFVTSDSSTPGSFGESGELFFERQGAEAKGRGFLRFIFVGLIFDHHFFALLAVGKNRGLGVCKDSGPGSDFESLFLAFVFDGDGHGHVVHFGDGPSCGGNLRNDFFGFGRGRISGNCCGGRSEVWIAGLGNLSGEIRIDFGRDSRRNDGRIWINRRRIDGRNWIWDLGES